MAAMLDPIKGPPSRAAVRGARRVSVTTGDAHAGVPFLFCSPAVFRGLWLGILLLHELCAVAYTMSAYAHYYLFPDGLTLPLSSYGFAYEGPILQYIAMLCAAFGLLHSASALWMIIWTLVAGRLVFGRGGVTGATTTVAPGTTAHRQLQRQGGVSPFRWLFGRDGVFGLRGRHFHLVLLGQELFEIILQTAQAYNLSRWLGPSGLSRAYITLAVTNCWSTTIITRAFRRHPAMERLVCRIWDLLTDAISALAVPTIVLIPYIRLFDPELRAYPFELLWDNAWVIKATNEYKIMVISSPWDLFSTVVFSVLILMSLFSLKASIRELPRSSATAKDAEQQPHQSQELLSKAMQYEHTRVIKCMQAACCLWGVIIIVVHAHAETRPDAPNCQVQVYPWLQTEPACAYIRMNCSASGATGTAEEVRTTFRAVVSNVVRVVEFRHCPALVIPREINRFQGLIGIHVYNSTLVQWEEDAVLLADTHPVLAFVHFVRTTMGEFPLALVAGPLPPLMCDFELAGTNLSSLPDKLDQVWTQPVALVLDNNSFTEVPDVVVRLRVPYLSFVDSQLTAIPAEILSDPTSKSRWFNGNPIGDLPENVTLSPVLRSLHLEQTQITALPMWFQQRMWSGTTNFWLGGSPICKELEASKSVRISDTCGRSTGDLFNYYPFDVEASFDGH